MQDSMKGLVAVVTGAGSRGEGIGNGRAISVLLARAGAKVALLDVDLAAAEETLRMIHAEGGEAAAFTCDVADPVSGQVAVAKVQEQFSRIDVLVNNVGISGPPGTALDVDLVQWENGFRVNVTGMMLMSRHCIPLIAAQGGGSVVNITSVAGLVGGNPSLLYPTTKAAIVGMTRTMATHHGPQNIRVNCVAPGLVYTPMVLARSLSEEMREQRRMAAPLQIEGTGWDVGEAVLFLASPASRWISGVTLPVDGGLVSRTYMPTAPRKKLEGVER